MNIHLDVFNNANSTALQKIDESLFEQHEVSLYIKRIDQVHPLISGNKWYKLKYNLMHAKEQGYSTLLSFGGAYSNHIHALAYAGKLTGFQTVGVIRGEAHEALNPTLRFAAEQGMQLHYVNREQYRQKEASPIVQAIIAQYAPCYVIPEGGSNALAVRGCREIVNDISFPLDALCCACGTGGTFAGLVQGLSAAQRAIGFAVLKGASFLERDVTGLLQTSESSSKAPWTICHDYHFGGYAKLTPDLKEFVLGFEEKHAIAIEPVYTGKMLYGVYDMVRRGLFSQGEKIVVVHSGGLQGRETAMSRV